jgi:ribonuclease HI
MARTPRPAHAGPREAPTNIQRVSAVTTESTPARERDEISHVAKKPKPKFYAVWQGRRPGVYSNWTDASEQVTAFPGAKFKSFDTRAEAEAAFAGAASDFIGKKPQPTPLAERNIPAELFAHPQTLVVDAACAGVPGPVEYRGVHLATGEQAFHQGPFDDGTNNIGEYLALVHGLAYLQQAGHHDAPIYSDSRNAIAWVRDKKCRTKQERTSRNARLFQLVDRADAWLRSNAFANPVRKWETDEWGEIPADFGRK